MAPEAGGDSSACAAPLRWAHASDRLLDVAVLALALWTAAYHMCLVSGLAALWAVAGTAAGLLASAWSSTLRRGPRAPPSPMRERPADRRRAGLVGLRVIALLAGTAAAALFAFTDVSWRWIWVLWIAAGIAGVAWAATRLAEAGATTADTAVSKTDLVVVAAWSIVMAALSLMLPAADADDTQYVRLSTWIAAHGRFPLRDTIFSDNVFPAVIWPPISSVEALAGTAARFTGLAAPDVVYLAVPPIAAVLGALAFWRLVRAWRLPLPPIALSVALLFLLLSAGGHRAYAAFFVGRIWQGKVAFLVVLVPLLYVFVTEYVERPDLRRLALLAAGGAAGVGLTSSAVFLVPVIALGCFAPFVFRAPRVAASGFAATVAYPVGTGLVTAVVGSERAVKSPYIEPGTLAEIVFGDRVPAFIALTAALAGPALIPRIRAAQTATAVVLVVGVLYAPPATRFIFDHAGLGRVLWRLLWAVPTAVLVAVLATSLLTRVRAPLVRIAPAVLIVAALAVWGHPLWSGRALDTSPGWKRPARSMAVARSVLDHTRPGDIVLAPLGLSKTLLVMSADVTTVAPRRSYTRALRDVPEAHADARLRLLTFAQEALVRPKEPAAVDSVPQLSADLRVVGVDVACLRAGTDAERLLRRSLHYILLVSAERFICLRAPAAG